MMRILALEVVVVMLVLGVLAGDMQIDFPLMLRAPMPAATTAASSTNLQTFTGALGGASADPITSTGDSTHPFAVSGFTFSDFSSALTRSCNNQHNACATIANSGGDKNITVGQCDTQKTSCLAAPQGLASSVASSTSVAAPTFKTADANFFYFCDA